MSIFQNFADNLRRECAAYPSVTAVCEGTGINRQQFSKYLSGKSLPNALTMRKICKFLNVSEYELFAAGTEDRLPERKLSRLEHSKNNDNADFVAASKKYLDADVRHLREGAYYCYFRLPNAPSTLVRSLVLVKRKAGSVSFVRLTVFNSSDRTKKHVARGRHQGRVFGNRAETYFLGINRYPPNQFSLMTLETANSPDATFLTGIMLTRSSSSLASVRVCLLYLGSKMSLRQALSQIGFVEEKDPSIGPMIPAALSLPLMA
jgi:transcriptional regulator with XRE-family HTH domain